MKDTYYFSHDYNARQDPKIIRLLIKHGFEGYGLYWAIIESLYQNANALPTDYDSIAYALRADAKRIESIVNEFDLFVVTEGTFGSLSVQRRIDERGARSAKAAQSARKRWETQEPVMRTQSERNANAPKIDAIKERKGKEIKEKESIEERKLKFTATIKDFTDQYPKDLLTEFYNYWTEHNEGGKKMRWEMEKVFNVKQRLATWAKRDKQFQQNKYASGNDQQTFVRPLLNTPTK